MRWRWVVLGLLALVLGACGDDDDAGPGATAGPTEEQVDTVTPTPAPEPDPTLTPAPVPESTPGEELEPVVVSGPLTGGGTMANAAPQDLEALGYVEEEFLFEGDASSYRLVGERSTDGVWDAEPADTAPFRTRMIVRRPADPEAFSGVVLVEWLNVSSGSDRDPDWGYLYREIAREGHAYVGVSAQVVGAVGGEPAVPGAERTGGLRGADAERYGSIEHPGDAYSYDIYTQAGRALVAADGASPLGGLEPTQVIAIGESQSAFYLTTYVDAVHPLVGLYDGFLVHSRGGAAPSLTGERDDASPVHIRTDLSEPVLMYLTESDLTVLGYAPARQDDTDTVRTWEVAGTAHADAWVLAEAIQQPRDASLGSLIGCDSPVNDGPQHETLQAALHHLVTWVGDGTPPPVSPRIELTADESPAIARDELGNALGGIRTPPVEVPLAALSGDPGGDAGTFCFLFGSTTFFDTDTVAGLYDSKDDFLAAYRDAADQAVSAGFLLAPDADVMVDTAAALYDRIQLGTVPG